MSEQEDFEIIDLHQYEDEDGDRTPLKLKT